MTTETDYRRRIYELFNVPYYAKHFVEITLTAEKTVFRDYKRTRDFPSCTLSTASMQFRHSGPDRTQPEGTLQIHWYKGNFLVHQWTSHPNCTDKGASEFPCVYKANVSALELYELLTTAHNDAQ